MRSYRAALCGFTLICSTACTVVQVEGGEVRYHAGSWKIEPDPEADAAVVRTRSIGLVTGKNTVFIGYEEGQTIVVPDRSKCIAFILLEESDDNDLKRVRELFKEYPNVCVN